MNFIRISKSILLAESFFLTYLDISFWQSINAFQANNTNIIIRNSSKYLTIVDILHINIDFNDSKLFSFIDCTNTNVTLNNVFFENLSSNIKLMDYFIGFYSSNDIQSTLLLIDLVFKNINLNLDIAGLCSPKYLHYLKGNKSILELRNVSISQIDSNYFCLGSFFILFLKLFLFNRFVYPSIKPQCNHI